MKEDVPILVHIESVPKSAIASLHLRYLSTPFSGKPGEKLLELYYEALSVTEQSIGLAAVLNGQTVGFACAVSDVRQIQSQLLKRSFFSISVWGFAQVLCKPQIWGGLVRRLASRTPQTSHWQRPDDLAGWYTYRPVVVDESYRKYRVADLLTQRLLEEAERRKIPGIISFVDQSNFRSIRHFSRNGFQKVWSNENSIVFGKKLIPSE